MHVEMHVFVQSNRHQSGYHNLMVAYNNGEIVKVQDFIGFHLYDQPYAVLMCLMQMFAALKKDGVDVRVYANNSVVQDALKSQYKHLIDGVHQYCAKHQVVFSNNTENPYHNWVATMAMQQAFYELEKATTRARCDERTIDRILSEAPAMHRIYYPMGWYVWLTR